MSSGRPQPVAPCLHRREVRVDLDGGSVQGHPDGIARPGGGVEHLERVQLPRREVPAAIGYELEDGTRLRRARIRLGDAVEIALGIEAKALVRPCPDCGQGPGGPRRRIPLVHEAADRVGHPRVFQRRDDALLREEQGVPRRPCDAVERLVVRCLVHEGDDARPSIEHRDGAVRSHLVRAIEEPTCLRPRFVQRVHVRQVGATPRDGPEVRHLIRHDSLLVARWEDEGLVRAEPRERRRGSDARGGAGERLEVPELMRPRGQGRGRVDESRWCWGVIARGHCQCDREHC
jgi:hypothetical protein